MKSASFTAHLFAGLTLAASLFAQADKPLLHDHPLPLIAAPSFTEPLEAPWSTAHGRWTPADGVMDVVELPEDHHVPVLHHNVGLQSAVIECEFRFDGPGTFLVGCDDKKHIGRVVITQQAMSITEDSKKPAKKAAAKAAAAAPEKAVAKTPPQTPPSLAKVKLEVKPGEWHHLRVEWKGDEMAARLDGKEIRARHPFLATPKLRSWLAVGKAAKIRNLKVSGETAAANP